MVQSEAFRRGCNHWLGMTVRLCPPIGDGVPPIAKKSARTGALFYVNLNPLPLGAAGYIGDLDALRL